MIRLATAIRTMPALWLSPVIVIAAGWYATLLSPADGYAVAASAKGTAALGLIVPFAAATAAWEGARVRRAGLWAGPWVRRRAVTVAASLWPSILVPVLATIAGVATALLQSGGGAPDVRMVTVAALDIAAFGLAGFAAGLLLPFAAAGPLSIVAPLFWLTFVPAMYPVWLRHVTGMFRDCCSSSEDLAIRPVLASSIVDLGLLAAAAVCISSLAWGLRAGAALASVVVTAAIGLSLVAGMEFAPVVPRDTAQLVCADVAGSHACVWPEHRSSLVALVRVMPSVLEGWRAVGTGIPTEFTEAHPAVAASGSAAISLSGAPTDDDSMIALLASSLLPAFPDCEGGGTGWQATEYLQAWFEWTGGMSQAGLALRHGQVFDEGYPPVIQTVSAAAAATPEVRQSWLGRVRAITQACQPWVVEELQVP